MTLRCVKGDMAVIVRCPHFPENEGALVDILFARGSDGRGALWWVRSRGRLLRGRSPVTFVERWALEGAIPDRLLRPIRPGDGVDEMVERAGRAGELPCEVIAGLAR